MTTSEVQLLEFFMALSHDLIINLTNRQLHAVEVIHRSPHNKHAQAMRIHEFLEFMMQSF
jgi:hypothetical protein